MRTRLLLASLSCCFVGCSLLPRTPAWELPPPPPLESPVVHEGRLHRFTLENGLAVLVLEDPRLPRVELGLEVRRGAAGVPRSRAGLASFTAEVMKRGAGERDSLALAQTVDALGASLAVSAGWDSMGVGLSGLSRDFDVLLELLADVALHPRFEEAEAVKARAEQLASLEQAKDSPSTLASWHLLAMLFPEHRYGRPRTGVAESVATFDASAARGFHASLFVPGNSIVFVVGDVDPAAVRGKLEQAFGGWPVGPVPDLGPPPPEETPEARAIVVVNRPELGQAQIALGHEGVLRSDPERVAVQLLDSVVGGGGFSSRLMTTARAEGGLTYGVFSQFAMGRQRGLFVVSTFTRVPEVNTMVELLLRELERARTEPPTATEVADAKSFMIGRFALGLESSSSVASSLVELDVMGLPDDSLDTFRARVRDVTVADAARVAERLLHPERLAIVVVGPAEQLVPQLERFGPVEVVEP